MIDKVETEVRVTRAQQRAATRLAILDATVACLIEDGYSQLTTRRIAERAGVAQSTVMHHIETREALLVEAVTHMALTLADRALEQIDLGALRRREDRELVLDALWRELASPQAVGAVQLWVAVWNEPELAPTLRELEERIGAIISTAAQALLADVEDEARLNGLIDATVFLIRGLLLAIPIWGRDVIDERWNGMKPFLLEAVSGLLDDPRA